MAARTIQFGRPGPGAYHGGPFRFAPKSVPLLRGFAMITRVVSRAGLKIAGPASAISVAVLLCCAGQGVCVNAAAAAWAMRSVSATPGSDDATSSQDKAGADKAKADAADKLTLERAFPEKGFFGPGARGATFSRDGRFGAFLYRSWVERRHGADLYVVDTTNGQIRRVTSVSRMAEFQADTRKVRDERIKKAKAAGWSLSKLAREQYEQLGWAQDLLAGTWEGAATSQGASTIAAGPSAITVTMDASDAVVCELRIGLVRINVKTAAYDASKGTLKLTVDDEVLKIKGEGTLTLSKGVLAGDLVLTEPAQTLSITSSRKPADKPDRAKVGPGGVLGAVGDRLTLAEVVTADDAEINDEKDGKPPKEMAPRYDGISSIEWSPKGHELLLTSGGDLYRLTIDLAKWDAPLTRPEPAAESAPAAETPKADDAVKSDSESATSQNAVASKDSTGAQGAEAASDDAKATPAVEAKPDKKKQEFRPYEPYRGELTRITRTREGESDVQYLPDGSGYTYLRDGALLRVTFGESQILQLDPELKDGERMVGYRISPDLKRLVFLASRSAPGPGGRGVTIISYRDRFAKAKDVGRHMPDDPLPDAWSSVYLYDLTGHDKEDGKLERVFTRRVTGPRDVMQVPEWSPDSKRVAFAAFEQKSGTMKILEAGFAPKTDKDKKSQAGGEKDATSSEKTKKEGDGQSVSGKEKGQESSSDSKAGEADAKPPEPDFKIENAKVVYEFLHHGGPNTPAMVSPQYLPDSRRMVFITEISGFRHLHMLDPRLEELSQITRGQFEVYPFFLSHDHTTLYATTTQGDPNQEHIYKITLENGEVTRLSNVPGVYNAVGVREDGSRMLAMHTDFGAPSELVMIDAADAGAMKRLTDSHPQEAHTLTRVLPEYFSYENRHGQVIHGHMFKPKDWTASDKRPLVIYVYGGPLGERKMATRGSFAAPSYFFARYMAETHGYVMATIDPRGASGYGAVFEKANFEQVGKPQTEDLIDGAKWLVKNHGVDERRTGLHGWSFGGFQTQMVMYSEPDAFAAGIAGAGPTEWQNYNSWYSTGTIGANEPGKVDLEKYSLLPLAKNLKGRLLLVHGMEDSNVLFQDTVRVYRELLKAKKEVNVELFLDPTGGHGLGGDVKTLGRYRKFEEFFVRQLGKGEAAKPDPKPEGKAGEPAPAAEKPVDAKADPIKTDPINTDPPFVR
jgi:dipeptidyl-peptidase-4